MDNSISKENNSNPLVSIIVITYNSSKFVLETLESAKAQTYQNIELIISDDSSKDDTVTICRKWLEENKDRFVHTELITVPENTGIPANCNRGVRASKGEWIKSIAGDDLLHKKCIEENLLFANENNYSAVFSKAQVFKDVCEETNFLFVRPKVEGQKFYSREIISKEQYKIMLNFNPIPAPTVFIKRSVLFDLGLFNVEYPYVEDYPMYMKVIKAGYKFAFLSQVTVYYRVHSATLSNSKVNINFINSTLKFLTTDVMPHCNYIRKISIAWNVFFFKIIDKLENHKELRRFFYILKNRLDPNKINLYIMKGKKLI